MSVGIVQIVRFLTLLKGSLQYLSYVRTNDVWHETSIVCRSVSVNDARLKPRLSALL